LLAGQSTGDLKYAAFLDITIPSWLEEKSETLDQEAEVSTRQKRRSREGQPSFRPTTFRFNGFLSSGSPDSPKQKRKKSKK